MVVDKKVKQKLYDRFIIQNYMQLMSINDEDLSDSNNPLQY